MHIYTQKLRLVNVETQDNSLVYVLVYVRLHRNLLLNSIGMLNVYPPYPHWVGTVVDLCLDHVWQLCVMRGRMEIENLQLPFSR